MCVMFESWFRLPPWTCMPAMGVPNSCNINTSPLSGPRRNAKEERWVPWSARLQERSEEICKNLDGGIGPQSFIAPRCEGSCPKRAVEGRRTQTCGNVQCHCRFHRFTFSPQGERGGQLFETERSFETNLQEMNGWTWVGSMTCFMWSLSCHGHMRWEHGMTCHDHGMSMYDMSCLNTGCLAMTVASCPCMTWHGICMKDMPWGAFGRAGLGGGLFSIKKVVASILTNSFILLNDQNDRLQFGAAVFWQCSEKKKQFHFLNLSGSPVSRILWLVNHWRALEFCRL